MPAGFMEEFLSIVNFFGSSSVLPSLEAVKTSKPDT
jgi:hypothetical protein